MVSPGGGRGQTIEKDLKKTVCVHGCVHQTGGGAGGGVRWRRFAHRGNAHRDSGIPVLGPYAVTVFPPGLQSQEHNTTAARYLGEIM